MNIDVTRADKRNALEKMLEILSDYDIHIVIDDRTSMCNPSHSNDYDSPTRWEEALEWKCKYDHIWKTKFDNIKNGSWCNECFVGSRCITLEDCTQVAKKRNGTCLSTECINGSSKLEWKCDKNHTWFATYKHIHNNHTWCPSCANYRYNETVCRKIFESIFEKKFISIRPLWLKNPETNFNLEIDIYNEELNIACEYNGRNHYEYISIFHKNKTDFDNQQKRDKLKYKLINERGLKFIIVPYTVKIKDMFDFVVEQCNKLNIRLPNSNDLIKIKEIILSEYVY